MNEVEGLEWIDGVFKRLLTPDGSKLKSEYELDGTHLHPSYVSLLGEGLTEIWRG